MHFWTAPHPKKIIFLSRKTGFPKDDDGDEQCVGRFYEYAVKKNDSER